jgi:hypothetical protein
VILIGTFCAGRRETTRQLSQVPMNENLRQRLSSHAFPRLANHVQACCQNKETKMLYEQLHYWDLTIVDAEIVQMLPEYLGPNGIIRKRNPNAVLLAAFSAGDINPYRPHPITADFNRGLDGKWYLRDIRGNPVPLYQMRPSEWTLAQNAATEVNEYMPRYLNEAIFRASLVDGIFYDWASTSVSWLNHTKPPRSEGIDIDNDGKADSDKKIDQLWTEGFLTMLKNSRRVFPPGVVIMGNAGWNTGKTYSSQLNGIMIEQFVEAPRKYSKSFGWGAVMNTYVHYQKTSVQPRICMIMANDDRSDRYKKMRFALASTLMFDGYFCFTNLKNAYSSIRWYDEYAVELGSGKAQQDLQYKGYLGKPVTDAFYVDDPSQGLEKELSSDAMTAETKVWRRDYDNGVVLVNPSKKDHTIKLDGVFKKIQGTVDSRFNDGSTLTEIHLSSRSGVILLKAVSR